MSDTSDIASFSKQDILDGIREVYAEWRKLKAKQEGLTDIILPDFHKAIQQLERDGLPPDDRACQPLESALRDQKPTYEFGAAVMNRAVLPRTDQIQNGEMAIDALLRWLTERDQLQQRVKEMRDEMIKSADCIVALRRDKINVETTVLNRNDEILALQQRVKELEGSIALLERIVDSSQPVSELRQTKDTEIAQLKAQVATIDAARAQQTTEGEKIS